MWRCIKVLRGRYFLHPRSEWVRLLWDVCDRSLTPLLSLWALRPKAAALRYRKCCNPDTTGVFPNDLHFWVSNRNLPLKSLRPKALRALLWEWFSESDTRALYWISFHNPLLLSSRRDVPVERLYKIVRVAEKGGIKRGFGIRGLLDFVGSTRLTVRGDHTSSVKVIASCLKTLLIEKTSTAIINSKSSFGELALNKLRLLSS